MDGYLYNLDSYRQAPASYYAPRYALDRRSSYGLPASDPYARIPIDPYSGYGAPPSYLPDFLPRPRYASPPLSPAFRSRPRPGPKRKPPPAQNLGPKKQLFKQTQKVRFSEDKGRPSKKPLQKQPSQATASPKVQKTDGKAKSQSASLAKETQELHSLFRTGVDPKTGKKFEEIARKQGEGKKRKAETQTQKSTPVKSTPGKEAVSSAKKRQRGKKNKKSANDKKPKVSTPVVEKAEPFTLTEEEKKEAELALELQRGLCERVCEFLGSPVPEKPETNEEESAAESDAKPEDNKEKEKPSKPEEPERTPEEENEADEKSFEYFSKLFEENEDLRKLYIDKCNSGSFECLVCYSTEVRSTKQFWNLVSLVMHTKMRKQKRPEHRGYGRAVSAVLGWDHLNTPKVPRTHRHPTATDKPAEQVKEEKEPEAAGKTADIEEKEADFNATEGHQEEKAAEVSSKDSKEE